MDEAITKLSAFGHVGILESSNYSLLKIVDSLQINTVNKNRLIMPSLNAASNFSSHRLTDLTEEDVQDIAHNSNKYDIILYDYFSSLLNAERSQDIQSDDICAQNVETASPLTTPLRSRLSPLDSLNLSKFINFRILEKPQYHYQGDPSLAYRRLYHIRLTSNSKKSHLDTQIQGESKSCKSNAVYYEAIDYEYSNVIDFVVQSWRSAWRAYDLSRDKHNRVIMRFNCFNPFAIPLALFGSRRMLFLFHTKYYREFTMSRHAPVILECFVFLNVCCVKLFSRRYLAVTPEVALSDAPSMLQKALRRKAVIYPNSI